MNPTETTLALLPAHNPRERLVVVLCHHPGGSRVELRQQSWGEGIGWFTQHGIRLEPGQVAQLRQVLGTTGHRPDPPPKACALGPRDLLPWPGGIPADSA